MFLSLAKLLQIARLILPKQIISMRLPLIILVLICYFTIKLKSNDPVLLKSKGFERF